MGYNPKYRRNHEDDICEAMKTYPPKSIAQLLKDYSDNLGLPISKLIAIAVDNELDTPHPFNYPCVMPETEYRQDQYLDEALKIKKFLEKIPPIGTGKDTLMLARRDIGIPDREIFMEAYRELLQNEIIEETEPPRASVFKKYRRTYRYVKLKEDMREDIVDSVRKART